jgi:hypothetical protein
MPRSIESLERSLPCASRYLFTSLRFDKWLVLFCKVALVTTSVSLFAQSGIVISQVYGGGGNSGATLRNDYVELFNRSRSPLTVDGWTLQHTSANGSSWDRAYLNGTVQPGQYYLIQLAQGNSGSVSLPSPDASSGMNISATSSKIVLVSNSALLSGSLPSGGQVIDFVGYGSTNTLEGNAAPLLSNTTALFRRSGGCADSNNNSADFTTAPPAPRNSRSPFAPCFAEVTPLISSAGIVNAASFVSGPIAPGQVLTIFGSNLGPDQLATLQLTPDELSITKSLAGTRVLFDGKPD